MTKPKAVWLFLTLLVLVGTTVGCGKKQQAQASITLAGSTSVQPFAEAMAEEFMKKHPGVAINVQGGGSSAGPRAVRSGAAQIGMLSRELKKDEKDLKEWVIAHDAIAVVINPVNSLTDLSGEQVRGIFGGSISSWSEIGGPNKKIHVISREEGSGTRGAFDELIMGKVEVTPGAVVQDSNGSVRETVAGDPYSIGYVSLGLVDPRVKAVRVGGVEATVAAVVSKKYALVRPFLFATQGEPQGLAKDFIDFVLGPEGQKMLREEGLVPVR